MFHAVRTWWKKRNGKRLAGLFAFELTVVVIGVFLAQSFANWAETRANIQRMERSHARARQEIGQNFTTALVWQQALPCLDARLTEIMRQAAVGPVSPALTERPRVQSMVLSPLSTEDALLMREQIGQRHVDLFDNLVANVANLNRHVADLSANWGRIQLADERFGPVSDGDRLAARSAAADVRANLRGIGIVALQVVERSRALGAKPIDDEPGYGPARSCEAIWKSGRIRPPIGIG